MTGNVLSLAGPLDQGSQAGNTRETGCSGCERTIRIRTVKKSVTLNGETKGDLCCIVDYMAAAGAGLRRLPKRKMFRTSKEKSRDPDPDALIAQEEIELGVLGLDYERRRRLSEFRSRR